MKRAYCDVCGEPATKIPKRLDEIVSHVLPECDKSALVTMRVVTGFRNHSTGYGGPPDLCNACFITFIEKILEIAKLTTKV